MIYKKTMISSIQLIVGFCFFTFFLSLSQAEVTLTIGDGSGLPGSEENPVEVKLDNLNDRVRGLQVDLCEVDDYLFCTACETTGRTSGFTCETNERDNGCCGVVLVSESGDLIEKGTGAIFILRYNLSEEAPGGECRELNAENVKVSDELENELTVNISSGKFCSFICGDIYPDESSPGANDCGDGVVDIFDVLEAIDIVLGVGVHSDCQLTRADLPTGTPPNCRDPDGIIDVFDVLVIVDLVLNRKDCCSYYYGVIKCTTDQDCDDGIYCNGIEICVEGACQPGTDPCTPLLCDEEGDVCVECFGNLDCDDGLYCNGGESCVDLVCQDGEGPCTDDGQYCNGTDTCNEDFDLCMSTGDPCPSPLVCDEETDTCGGPLLEICDDGIDNDEDGLIDCVDPVCDELVCNDGLYCTVEDACVDGECVGTERYCDDGIYCTGTESCNEDADHCEGSGDPCAPNKCDEVNDICVECLDDADCDDGLYCNGAEYCDEVNDECKTTEFPCDDSNECTDDICYEVDDSCSSLCNASSFGDPCCDDPACADAPICAAGALINLGDAWANCGDVGVKIPICLENLENAVGGIQMDLCESIDDCLECTECELTERSTMFDCVVNELQPPDPNAGCCRVILFGRDPGSVINPGRCDVVIIAYTLKDLEQCCNDCIEIDADNLVVTDQGGYEIGAEVGDGGSICPFPFGCGDVEPADDLTMPGWDCGDEEVGIFDVLEETAFSLGTKTPDACQAVRADVPTGTPPYCNDPDGVINVLDLMVIIDMSLDRPDCCSYYYEGKIY